jgi:hypothetical protein
MGTKTFGPLGLARLSGGGPTGGVFSDRKKKNQVDFRQKSRDVLTFFDRLYFHIRHPYGAISVQKTPFGQDSHTPRKHRLGLR